MAAALGDAYAQILVAPYFTPNFAFASAAPGCADRYVLEWCGIGRSWRVGSW
jgi:hypothetical protein